MSGVYKDTEDNRDYIKEIKDFSEADVNLLGDNKLLAPSQGSSSACTGYAASSFMSILYSKLSGDILKFNPYFIYYLSRKLLGWENVDDGSRLRETMRAMSKYGVLPTNACSLKCVKDIPDVEDYTLAFPSRVRSYFRLPDGDIERAIKYTLTVEKLPVLVSLEVEDRAWDDAGKEGLLRFLGCDVSGGHAVCIYGYDKSEDVYLAVNSWGTLWGNAGHFKIHPYVLNCRLMDAWSVGYNYF